MDNSLEQISVKRNNTCTKQFLDYLNKVFRENRLFLLSFGNDVYRTSCKLYFSPTSEIKDHNFMIEGQNLNDQPVKSNQRTFDHF